MKLRRMIRRHDMYGCVLCGNASCADGGHQAIRLDEKRRPMLDLKKCVGCHLCVLVCPALAILSSGKRVAKVI